MKNSILIISSLLFFSLNILALPLPVDSLFQIKRNQLFVGGNLNFRTGQILTNSAAEGYEINIAPKVGYFIINRLALGLGADIQQYNYNKGVSTGNSISIGPLARYYLTIRKNAIVFELAYNYGKEEDKSTISFTSSPPPITISLINKSIFYQYSFGAGYTYFIGKSLSIEALYQYKINQEHYSNNYGYTSTDILTKKQSNITAGLLFYF